MIFIESYCILKSFLVFQIRTIGRQGEELTVKEGHTDVLVCTFDINFKGIFFGLYFIIK